jgi:hypothetical protein
MQVRFCAVEDYYMHKASYWILRALAGCAIISILGCGNFSSPTTKVSLMVPNNQHNLRVLSESGWKAEIWTSASLYHPSNPVDINIVITAPVDFSGKYLLEVVVSAPTIGGGRKSSKLVETRQIQTHLESVRDEVEIKDVFLSDYRSVGSTPLNRGKHRVNLQIRTEPGVSFEPLDITLDVEVLEF